MLVELGRVREAVDLLGQGRTVRVVRPDRYRLFKPFKPFNP
ncbi:hypothetical protein ACFV4P_07155 [Kitasatospora sp. NPDC059795]